jgi:hypothetical protein
LIPRKIRDEIAKIPKERTAVITNPEASATAFGELVFALPRVGTEVRM